jgi:hypothetical protein
VWFSFLLGRFLYDAKTGFFAALFLFFSPVYFAQSGMFLADVPVAALGVASTYFALRRNFLAYVLTASHMVFIKETSIALLVALLFYLFLTTKPKTWNNLQYLFNYSMPLFFIGRFFIWQKLATGYFFFIYPSINIELFNLTTQSIFTQFVIITKWLFIAQHRYIYWALIVVNIICNRVARGRPELWLLLLICAFSGYSFSVLYFLLRYLLPVLPYIYLLGTWSLMELAGREPWKTATATGLLLFSIWYLASGPWSRPSEPFSDNGEFNLKYLDVVGVHKEMGQFVASEFPHARILTDWPHIVELTKPHVGYVERSLPSISLANRDLTSFADTAPFHEIDLILVSVTPPSTQVKELRAYVLKHGWRLIRRIAREPVVTELYGRPALPEVQ